MVLSKAFCLIFFEETTMNGDEIIRRIYRGATEWPFVNFQPATFDALSELIPFDLGMWGFAGKASGSIVDVHLYQQPKRMLEVDMTDFQHGDFLADAVFNQPGKVINQTDSTSREAYKRTRIYKEIPRPQGMQQALSTCWVEPVSGLIGFMSLWRKSSRQIFTEIEKVTLQRLLPHIAEAHRLSRIAYMRQFDLPALQSTRQATALCTPRGALIEAESTFFKIMNKEWVAWHGTTLPFTLQPLLTEKKPYRGTAVVITAQALDDMVLVRIRAVSKLDMLGKKQLQIAQSYAQGENYQEIAGKFSIAENTARSHIATIFKKCDVHNKAELATLLYKTPLGNG